VIFSFIKYTQPSWYFNIVPKAKSFATCYYHPQWLPLPNACEIDSDSLYETESARNADIGYNAWNKGYFLKSNNEVIEKIKLLPKPTINDEYRFLIKYWGIHWAALTFVRRVLTFHNPIKEIIGFMKNYKTPKSNLFNKVNNWDSYHSFSSELVLQQPLVSVIIPTLNRYEYLEDVMLDLEKQTWKNFEVIVVDQSENFEEQFYKKFSLNINVVQQKEKLLWTARNLAVKMSKANYLLFFDDDSRVEPDWIEQHIKTLEFFNSDISAGVSLAVIGGKISKSYDHFRWADQFDSGNALVKREVFNKIGLFDLQFNKERMGDSEFGLRAYLNGYNSVSNPYAKRVHLKVSSGGLREIGHWDAFRPKKLFAPKPVPSVIYLFKKYYPKHLYKSSVYLGIMLSNISYKNKSKNSMLLLSIILTVFKLPLLYIQLQKSLSIANKKLADGDMIEKLL
jgi:GT2 family glycosyltransferase